MQASTWYLIAPEAEPPVVKVMDYGKHLFDKKKAKAAQRKRQKQTHVKEVKFRPGTEEGDYQIKLRNLIRFLEEGDKTKISLRFKGREMAHPELGATYCSSGSKATLNALASPWRQSLGLRVAN